METKDGIVSLQKEYSHFDWYDSVGLDRYGRYVVYVTKMDLGVMTGVRQSLDGKQVLISYAQSKPENLTKYHTVTDFNAPKFKLTPVVIHEVEREEDIEEEDEADVFSIDKLIMELDRLEKICGPNILQDIFFEIHDGKNAVTNLSNKFTDVRITLEKLYNDYGFDIIYEELDG